MPRSRRDAETLARPWAVPGVAGLEHRCVQPLGRFAQPAEGFLPPGILGHDAGRRQAQVTGARLARTDLAVDRVVSGALTRQRDTAEAVLAALGWPASRLRIDERLDEYDHVGVMALYPSEVTFETATADGERGRALQSTLEEAIGRWIAGDSGDGETHDAFIGRVMDAITELAAAPGGTIAVTSGMASSTGTMLLSVSTTKWPDATARKRAWQAFVADLRVAENLAERAATEFVTADRKLQARLAQRPGGAAGRDDFDAEL